MGSRHSTPDAPPTEAQRRYEAVRKLITDKSAAGLVSEPIRDAILHVGALDTDSPTPEQLKTATTHMLRRMDAVFRTNLRPIYAEALLIANPAGHVRLPVFPLAARNGTAAPHTANRIMDRVMYQLDHPGISPAFPEFSDLFNVLIQVNDLTITEIMNRLNEHFQTEIGAGERSPYNLNIIKANISGVNNPSYGFIEALLASNVFKLDDKRIQQGGDYRAAFFAMAGLTEVTPISTRAHNVKVLKQADEALERGERLHWGEVIKDLLSIYLQGELHNYTDIQKEIRTAHPELFIHKDRLRSLILLIGQPIDAEREAIYAQLNLSDEQKRWLETEYRDEGRLTKKTRPARETGFSQTLNTILTTLEENAVGTTDLERASIPHPGRAPGIRTNELYQWRKGDVHISLNKLRALVRLLSPYVAAAGEDKHHSPRKTTPITTAQIDAMITGAGYTREQLQRPADQIIDESNHDTDIKTLLKSLREASDVGMTIAELCKDSLFEDRPMQLKVWQLNKWENPKLAFPNAQEAREVLERMDTWMRIGQNRGLKESQIDKVVQLADAAYKKWKSLSFTDKQKLARTPPRPVLTSSWREMIASQDGQEAHLS
jgi:hypothetical protein